MKRRNAHRYVTAAAALVVGVAAGLVGVPSATAANASGGGWEMGGHDLSNTRNNPDQTTVTTSNVSRLAPKWTFTTHGDVSATAAVKGGVAYFPDWAGYLYAVNSKNGALLWSIQLPDSGIARTSPAVNGNTVFIGDQSGYVYGISAKDGTILWRTRPNAGPFPIITQSPVYYNGMVFVGSASSEEGVAANPTYPCCSARGSIQALDAKTGAVKWITYTIPDKPAGWDTSTDGPWYSGAGVWGSTPAVDPATGTIYVTTGNNYSVPNSVKACQDAANGDPVAERACLDPGDHVDSVLALDTNTGAIKWATGVRAFDDWNVGCFAGPGSGNCPTNPGPDFDFGSGPNLFTFNGEKVIGAGQKSGEYWLLNATTGAIKWGTQVGPGSTLGGIEWGTATDGKRIYVAISNYFTGQPNPAGGTAGSFNALDPATGQVLWGTPDPSGMNFGFDLGAVSTSNGVVYAGSMSGIMYAMDAATGQIRWQYQGQGSSNAGAAIDDSGTVYWGNGYGRFGLGSPSTTFYAFSLDGK